jgi:hypothetical protein
VNVTSGQRAGRFHLKRSMYTLNYNGNNDTDNIFVGYGSGVGLQGISGTVSLTTYNSYNFIQFNDDEDTTARTSPSRREHRRRDYQQSTGLIPGVVRYATATRLA